MLASWCDRCSQSAWYSSFVMWSFPSSRTRYIVTNALDSPRPHLPLNHRHSVYLASWCIHCMSRSWSTSSRSHLASEFAKSSLNCKWPPHVSSVIIIRRPSATTMIRRGSAITSSENTHVFSDEVIADRRLIIVVADGHRMMITNETCGGHLQLSDDLANSEARWDRVEVECHDIPWPGHTTNTYHHDAR